MSPDYPHHPNDCWCVACWNHAQLLMDIARRKVARFPTRDVPKACDSESMMTWFSYEDLK
jgi:hypothetical protein